MQDYYPPAIHESLTSANADTPIYLRPEQIILSKERQKTAKSLNSAIRLTESVKKYGILEPLTVKPIRSAAGIAIYELIEGSRRLHAAISAGITRIPCILLAEDRKSDAISSILMNLQTGGLHIFEQAAALRLLMSDFGMTQKEIARKTGLSQSSIANKTRLLQLSKEEQQRILIAKLSERHARALLRLKRAGDRNRALDQIIEKSMTVAIAEQMIDEIYRTSRERSKTPPSSSVSVQESPPNGVVPRKFAIQSLTPLYNSIERTLSIFRKTGAIATCQREEGPCGVRIIIDIPKNN